MPALEDSPESSKDSPQNLTVKTVSDPPSWPDLEASNIHQNWRRANDDAV